MRCWTDTFILASWLAICFGSHADVQTNVSPAAVPAIQMSPASPTALAVSADGKFLYCACATENRIAILDAQTSQVISFVEVPKSPLGLALSKDGTRLYAVCAAPESTVVVIDTSTRKTVNLLRAGHTAMAPVLSADENTLFVCNRFDNDISVIDLKTQREIRRIPVEREPCAAAITPDGKLLLVANHLHAGRATDFSVQASVSVIETRSLTLKTNIPLTVGAGMMRGIAVSPDGRFAAVTHLRSLYWLTTSTVEMGRMNCNALSVLDLNSLEVMGVLLLDQTTRGAANPWDVAWTADGKSIIVSLAGAQEIAVVEAPRDTNRDNFFSIELSAYEKRRPDAPAPKNPVRVRQRIAVSGVGPRGLAVAGSTVYAANYFSDNITRIDLADSESGVETLSLGPMPPMTLAREGEMLFNDARICIQGWQSCASCHDTDARADGLNWDLLNDGKGNPKNTRSLLWAHRTGPAMSLGVRASAGEAVRAGIHHILFTEQPEEVPLAIEAFLKSQEPIPSPKLIHGELSAAAKRGKQLFEDSKTGCITCHPPPNFTDAVGYNVGTGVRYHGIPGATSDKATDRFYSPTLVELWRTAPYLHDGSANAVRDVFTTKNPNDQHGMTSTLKASELDDLAEYLMSL